MFFNTFNPFSQSQQFFTAWRTAVRDQLGQMETFDRQLAEAQALGVQRAQEAIDESSKLMKASFTYSQQLGEQWRKQMFDLARQTTDLMTAVG